MTRIATRSQVVGDASADVPPAPAGNEAETGDGEFEFVGADERDLSGGDGAGQGGTGGIQTLADATEEQAAASARAAAQKQEHDENGEAAAHDVDAMDAQPTEDAAFAADDDAAPPPPDGGQDPANKRSSRLQRRGAASERTKGPTFAASVPSEQQPGSAADGGAGEAAAAAAAAAYERALQPPEVVVGTSIVALHLERTRLDDAGGEAHNAAQELTTPALTEDQVAALRAEAEEALAAWRGGQHVGEQDSELAARANALWKRFDLLTAPLASELCEQLRLILEPTLAAKLQGDYRTGKRLNMRKIIPYLASEFRRDKIWLRRSKPSVRKYQVRFGLSARLWLRSLGIAMKSNKYLSNRYPISSAEETRIQPSKKY